MKRNLRYMMIAVAAVIFVGSGAMMLYKTMEHQAGAEVYAEAETLAGLPALNELASSSAPATIAEEIVPMAEIPDTEGETESAPEELPQQVWVDPYADALANMDFSALRAVNSDVLGWILIPGTQVSYPLLQGDDNEYYLNRTWRKGWNSMGSIFMEQRNSSDLSDFNTIIYGHRMQNLSMFGSLKKYKDQNYWAANPNVYITDDAGTHKYVIFAAYEAGVADDAYRLLFADEAEKQRCIDLGLSHSVIATGIVPTVNDRIITLSTCTGRGYESRWVVQAVYRETA